ncbi:ORF6N domain-containing protein [Candidatus Omnitrophota bacterium]
MRKKLKRPDLIPSETIESKILLIRGKKVMLDKDLAELYKVDTRQLTRQVRRNIDRFPDDFMFLLTRKELMNLKCQFGTSSWGGTRKLPYAFTEHGILMLSSVLNSQRAILVNIQIMRTFVSLKRMLFTYEGLRRKIEAMEKKCDGQFQIVFTALRKLMEPPPEKPRRMIGFKS